MTLLALILSLGLMTGAVAQSEGLIVTITGVESQAFPQVNVSVAVSDENGPLDGLTAGEIRIFEDGVEVPAAAITVEPDTRQNLALVLALDVSMPDNDLAEVKAAAKTLVGSMGPRDKVAVIAFADKVNVVHDFTNNTQELQAVIDGLTAGGSLTALHEALIKATTMVEQLPKGRKGVVVVTDSRDNTGALTADEAISRAQESRTPLYVAGFGKKVRSDPLKDKISLTGGQYFSLPDVEPVQTTLQEVEAQLRRGYNITFLSDLEADNAEHDLSVTVTHQGSEGQAEGRFVAVPGEVIVSLPNLAEGQVVAGVVNLTPEIIAPAPIVSVQYLLDGRLLKKTNVSPYSFEWDSTTAQLGPHTLAVMVVDKAGNQGQTELNLEVAVPLKVEVSTSRTEVELGDKVIIQANVEAIAELAKVELFLDEQLVAGSNAPPYSFTIDSSQYQAGAHNVTVRAEDSLEREATDQLTLQFQAPPVPEPPLWRRLVSRLGRYLVIGMPWVAGATFIVFMALLGLLILTRIQKRQPQEIYRLELVNLGNVSAGYKLRAEDSQGALEFQFTQNGAALLQPPGPQFVEAGPVEFEEVATAPAAPPQPPPSVSSSSPASSDGGGMRQTVGKAKEGGGMIQGLVYAIASIFNTLGYLIPGSAGRSVQRVGQQLSSGQARVRRVTNVPTRMARQAGQLRGQVAQVAPSTSRAGTSRVGTPTGPGTATIEAAPAITGGGYQNRVVSNGYRMIRDIWVQILGFVRPGETSIVDLRISPIKKPYRTQSYSFKVHSKTIGPEDSPVITESGAVEIRGVSRLRRLIPYLIFAIIMIIVVSSVFFLLLNQDVVVLYLRESLINMSVW